MIMAGVLAFLAALASKLGGLGLLYGFVLLLAASILFCFTKLPLRPALAYGIVLVAIALHIALIKFFFPIAAEWANEAMYDAAKRGYTIQMDEDEMQEFFLTLFVVVFGYLPAIIVTLGRITLLDVYKASGGTRLVLSLWLLILPFLAAWFGIQHYKSLSNSTKTNSSVSSICESKFTIGWIF